MARVVRARPAGVNPARAAMEERELAMRNAAIRERPGQSLFGGFLSPKGMAGRAASHKDDRARGLSVLKGIKPKKALEMLTKRDGFFRQALDATRAEFDVQLAHSRQMEKEELKAQRELASELYKEMEDLVKAKELTHIDAILICKELTVVLRGMLSQGIITQEIFERIIKDRKTLFQIAEIFSGRLKVAEFRKEMAVRGLTNTDVAAEAAQAVLKQRGYIEEEE